MHTPTCPVNLACPHAMNDAISSWRVWMNLSWSWWRRKEPYLAALLALALFSPVLVWNAQHGWASFVFQTSRRVAEAPQFALHKLIGSMVVLLTPTGLLAVAGILVLGGILALCVRHDRAAEAHSRSVTS